MMSQPRHGECFPASITILYYAAGVYFHTYEISRVHGFCTSCFPLKYGFIIVQICGIVLWLGKYHDIALWYKERLVGYNPVNTPQAGQSGV